MAAGARDLCTVADIQAYVPGYTTDASTDAVLQELVTSVSTEIHNRARREFVKIKATPYDKVFDLTASQASTRKVWVGDLAAIDTDFAVAVTERDGTAVAALDETDTTVIIGLPRNRQEWEPINELWFPAGLGGSPTLIEGYVMTVAGTWGFPSVPTNIKTACIKLVVYRYMQDVALGGTDFADAVRDGIIDIGSGFRSAVDDVESYRFWSVA